MKKYKVIGYKFPVKLHAELKARLFYDEIPMTKFIRSYVEAYLNKDSLVLEFINQYKEQEKIQNKKKRNENKKLIEKGKKIESLFGLSKEEIEDIYDVITDNTGGSEV
jgi:hypothetical protein